MAPETEERVLGMLTEIAVTQKQHGETLRKLDYTVNGNGKPGLKTVVDRHDQSLKFYSRLFWTVGTPILAAIGGGLVYLLSHIK